MAFGKAKFIQLLSFWLSWLKTKHMGPKVAPEIEGFQGSLGVSVGGRMYAAYEGIRYAQPPVGDLRFKDPLPIEGNENFQGRIDCLHADWKEDIIGQEDCLVLNVFTPNPQRGKIMPVMIWIHGSSFLIGPSQSSVYGPQRLMDYDLVLVTMSYRLGPLGFASLEDKTLPGNYGLRDQNMAIRWVIENIHIFGGDLNRITLAGHGAGAVSVVHHLHGKTWRAISRAIALSGNRYVPWYFSPPGEVKENTANLIASTGCANCNDTAAVECLRKLDSRILIKAANYNTRRLQQRVLMPFRPVDNDDSLLYDPNRRDDKLRASSLLLGVTSAETGFFFMDLTSVTVRQNVTAFKSAFDNYLKHLKREGLKLVEEKYKKQYEQFIDYYGKKKNPEKALTELTSDILFLHPTISETRRHLGTVHAFMFNYTSRLQHLECTVRRIDSSVAHGDELPFLFLLDRCGMESDTEHQRFAKKFTSFIVRFVMAPTEPGLPTSQEDSEMFDIQSGLMDISQFRKISKDLAVRMGFWNYDFMKQSHIRL